MSISPRATIGVLLLLLAGFPALSALPNDAASVRVAGLSLLWWYGGLVAPVAAAATVALGAWRSGPREGATPDRGAGADAGPPPAERV